MACTEEYGDDEATLSRQFVWMKLLLERTDTIAHGEKEQIRERLNMFDQLWEESPMVQKMRKQSYEEGEVRNLQRTLVEFVKIKFPELTDFAQKEANMCNKLDVLENITRQLFTAPDSKTAQQLLESISE
jgi:hypothetical protein